MKVIAAPGQSPIVDGGTLNLYAVDFQFGAGEATLLEGITVRGGTSAVVRLQGNATVRNCTVDGAFSNTPTALQLLAVWSGARIENCTIHGGSGHGVWGDLDGVLTGGSITVSEGGTGMVWTSSGGSVEGVAFDVAGGIGLRAVGGYGEIRNCSITMTEGTGVQLESPVVLESCTVRSTSGSTSSVGIQDLGASSATIRNCFVTMPAGPSGSGGIGIVLRSGTLEGCTIREAQIGVDNWGGLGTVLNCIASACWETGFYGSGPQSAVSYCIADGGVPYYPASVQGYGSVAEDPRFCDATNENLTLRIDSYGNPGNNPSGEQIGAFPAACAYGTLARNATLLAGKEATVWQDVTVPAGKTLTLGAGARLLFDPIDESGGGSYITKNELLVSDEGGLVVSAAGGGRATFTPSSGSPAPGAWGLIQIQGGASVSLDHAQIEYAEVGLHYMSDDPENIVQDVVFANNNLEDVHVDKALSGPNGPDGRFVNCTFGSDGAYGVRVNWEAQDLRFEDCTWSGSSTPLVGLAWEYSGGTVQGGLVTGFTAGTGIRAINSAAPTCTGVTFGNNKYGVEWRNTAGGQINGCTFNAGMGSAPYDIWVRNTAAPLITGNVFPAASLATAVRTDDSAHPTVGPNNTITSQLNGLSAQGSSTPVFRGNTVSGCTYGVSAAKTAHPNLGTEATWGNNSITGSTNMAVLSKSRSDSLTAKRNWWGIDPPIPTKFSAYVGYRPWLHQPPGGLGMAARNVTPVPVSLKEKLLVSPNPMRQEASFTIMGTDEQAGTAQIFDITGRLVRILPFEASNPLTVTWDGTDARGGRVPGGVYLYRVRAGGFEDKGRVVVVR